MARDTRTKAQLAAELDEANRKLARSESGNIETALSAFKDEVREKAMELKEEHGFCDVIDSALKDLGINPMGKEYQFTLMVPIHVRAALAPGVNCEVTEEYVRQSARVDFFDADEMAQDTDGDDGILDGDWALKRTNYYGEGGDDFDIRLGSHEEFEVRNLRAIDPGTGE